MLSAGVGFSLFLRVVGIFAFVRFISYLLVFPFLCLFRGFLFSLSFIFCLVMLAAYNGQMLFTVGRNGKGVGNCGQDRKCFFP